MSFYRPFFRATALAVPAVAALVLLTPASILPPRAQAAEAAQQTTSSDAVKSDPAKSDSVKPSAAQTTGATGPGNVAAVDQANPSGQKSLTAKAIERVKEVAKSAGDLNSPIPTGWRRSCTGNTRPPTLPSSIAARAAKTRPK